MASSNDLDLLEKYRASMLLHAVGDAMGYKNGKWEFKFSGVDIHEELAELGGIENLKLDKKHWRVSDDTILHLAVAECLIQNHDKQPSQNIYLNLVEHYKHGMHDMKGNTTIANVSKLSKHREDGFKIEYNSKGGGCGVSMRSSCIGLRYSRPDQLNDLAAFAVESGRMTHHHPIGYLGGFTAALFTSYAIQGVEIKKWGSKLLVDLDNAKKYVKSSNYCVEPNLKDWDLFIEPWIRYLKERDIENGMNEPKFPEKYGVEERDEYYKKISGRKGWAGSSGVDSVIIAYDALLGCKGDWIELCERAMLHGGDNDSTGSIAGSWFGALYGFKGVPENNYKNIEYKDRILNCGTSLYDIQYKNQTQLKLFL